MTTPNAPARLDLKIGADEKDIIVKAAALMGTSIAGFVRAAAKEKAMQLLERESRVTLSQRDMAALTAALETGFAPNAALQDALAQAKLQVRQTGHVCRPVPILFGVKP